MDELILEPYAGWVTWRLDEGDDGRWPPLLQAFLGHLARACVKVGGGVVGHIKSLALFPGGIYLRGSATSPELPIQVEGNVPPGTTEVQITLNVVVYGIARDTLERLVLETATQTASEWGAQVSLD